MYMHKYMHKKYLFFCGNQLYMIPLHSKIDTAYYYMCNKFQDILEQALREDSWISLEQISIPFSFYLIISIFSK